MTNPLRPRHRRYPGKTTRWPALAIASALLTFAVHAQSFRFEETFDREDWYAEWQLTASPRNTIRVTRDPDRQFAVLDGAALRIRFGEGEHYGTSFSYRFKKQTGKEPEAIYFRYYLRFADDWKVRHGGKLPGIAGTYGRGGWGGRTSNGKNGWSARGLFRGSTETGTPTGFYCYHAGMKGKYGENWLWENGTLANNRWVCIEQYAKLNTPGKSDGILRGWIDGQLAFEHTMVRMRDVDTLKIETVWIDFYHGGRSPSPVDQHLYIDDLVISDRPIGPR